MSKALSPIEENRRTLAAQVAERIRQAILTRDLAPGSRVNQYQLAEDLNVSLVPVREALKTLEAEGLVTITPRRGRLSRRSRSTTSTSCISRVN
ncbi:MAG: GntR family transcriptional regulator [Chloroflexi bacterium]|uniref:GntR family transcriptional regulator n=1 Tax=Candidatus Flexifilum breve TaxID=3140694 RepID=UPI003136D658|nr:GntR family transcriptional regulator [Chloroflexota bacterium]